MLDGGKKLGKQNSRDELRKRERETGKGRLKMPEKMRDQERQGKPKEVKQGRATEVNPATVQCSSHMLSNIREKHYAGADSDLHEGDGHNTQPPPPLPG